MASSSRASRHPGRGFYTIGLTELFRHPELVAAGVDLGHAAHVVNDMAEMVADGTRFEVGQTDLAVPYATVSIRAVHPVHIAGGLVNMWRAHYSRRADPPALEVVQVAIEPARHQPGLDRAHTNLHLDRHPRRDRRQR